MIDIGIITGSGIYDLPVNSRVHMVETRFGTVEVSVSEVGKWQVGAISRHLRGHKHLPHTVPHQANLAALKQLSARAVVATSVVGAADPSVNLGQPILFDDLFFPENRLPDGSVCSIFTEPGDPQRGHSIQSEPFSPKLRQKIARAAGDLGLKAAVGGVYGHTTGPRFETRAEIRWLSNAGVTAVSQTCGPEAVLAGELEMPYQLVGYPVNYATGTAKPETKEDLDARLALAARELPALILKALDLLEEEDLVYEHGYVYRMDAGME